MPACAPRAPVARLWKSGSKADQQNGGTQVKPNKVVALINRPPLSSGPNPLSNRFA